MFLLLHFARSFSIRYFPFSYIESAVFLHLVREDDLQVKFTVRHLYQLALSNEIYDNIYISMALPSPVSSPAAILVRIFRVKASSWLSTVFQNKYISSDRVKLRGERGEWIPIIGKVFKKGQPPKKVNRPSDKKLKNNGTSKSKVYRKKQPFSSYGPKRGFQKRA